MYSVAVVGAGPAGLTVATNAQIAGWDAIVIEEHSQIGKPVHCTGIISKSGVEELGLDISDITVNAIRGARIFSPNKVEIKVQKSSTAAYVIERDQLDKKLAKDAIKAGVKIKTNTRLLNYRNETLFVESKGHGEILKSRLLVGADGPYSKTRSIMGIEIPKEKFVHAYQFRVKGNFDKNFVEVHLGEFAKGYFAWVVPENEEWARIGLAINSGSVRENFNKFLNKFDGVQEKCDMCSALIPTGEPFKEIVKDNIMLVGDAAFQTKSTTGGGILSGIKAGRACAKAIDEHYKNKKPLTNYWNYLGELNKELSLHWKIRKYLNSLNDQKTDNLFAKMKKSKAEEFLNQFGDMDKPSKFVGKIFKTPSMWRLFPEALSVMRK